MTQGKTRARFCKILRQAVTGLTRYENHYSVELELFLSADNNR